MKRAVTHRLDDTYIEKAWKHAEMEEMEEIENLAAELLGKAQEGQSIEDDLFCILYLALRCGFKKGHSVATG
jgi:type III secretory pathway component EscU